MSNPTKDTQTQLASKSLAHELAKRHLADSCVTVIATGNSKERHDRFVMILSALYRLTIALLTMNLVYVGCSLWIIPVALLLLIFAPKAKN